MVSELNSSSVVHNTLSLNVVWRKEIIPDDWSKAILLTIPMKGDRIYCATQLLRNQPTRCLSFKIFASLLLSGIMAVRNSRMHLNQARFKPGRGYADEIFTLWRVLKHFALNIFNPSVISHRSCSHLRFNWLNSILKGDIERDCVTKKIIRFILSAHVCIVNLCI